MEYMIWYENLNHDILDLFFKLEVKKTGWPRNNNAKCITISGWIHLGLHLGLIELTMWEERFFLHLYMFFLHFHMFVMHFHILLTFQKSLQTKTKKLILEWLILKVILNMDTSFRMKHFKIDFVIFEIIFRMVFFENYFRIQKLFLDFLKITLVIPKSFEGMCFNFWNSSIWKLFSDSVFEKNYFRRQIHNSSLMHFHFTLPKIYINFHVKESFQNKYYGKLQNMCKCRKNLWRYRKKLPGRSVTLAKRILNHLSFDIQRYYQGVVRRYNNGEQIKERDELKLDIWIIR